MAHCEPAHPHTSLIGRDDDLEAVADLVARPDVRLITITGVGGVGKTVLAGHVVTGATQDGFRVVMVEFAPIAEAAMALGAIARAVAISIPSGTDPWAHVARTLDEIPTVLLLDNLEHLSLTEDIAALLAATRQVTILVTSRRRLNLSGEWVHPLAPLPVPGHADPVWTVRENPAVRLFVQRLAQAGHPLAITPDNAPTLAELARYLDGIPLAIELAAGQGGVLTVAEMLDQLLARQDILRDGALDRLPRQHAMGESVRWSLGLLSEPARQGFLRLCAFRGSFDVETAMALTDLDRETFAILVDHGLVQALPPVGDRRQFRILIPIRQQGERLARQEGVLDGMRDRHAGYFLALAEQADFLEIAGGDAFDTLCRYEHEFLAALDWSVARGDVIAAARAAGTVHPFWGRQRTVQATRVRLRGIMDALAAQTNAPELVRLRLMLVTAKILHQGGELEASGEILDRTILDAQLHALHSVLAEALLQRIATWLVMRRPDDALALVDAAREATERANQPVLTAQFHFECASIALHRKEYDEAEAQVRVAMEANRQFDPRRQFFGLPAFLGMAYLGRGDPRSARACYERALRMPNVPEMSRYATRECLARLELQEGNSLVAASILEDCLRMQARWGSPVWIAWVLVDCAWLATLVGEDERAIDLLAGAGADDPSTIDLLVRDQITAMMETLTHRVGAADVRARLRLGPLIDRSSLIDETLAWLAGLSQPVPVPVSFTPSAPGGDVHLSGREREVLALIARGASNKQIAEALYIGTATVDTHVKTIYRKLGVTSRAAATAVALRLDLIDPR